MEHSTFDATISVLDAAILALHAVTSPLARVSGNCSVGITPRMCNRVTNHRDLGIFSRPAVRLYLTGHLYVIRAPIKSLIADHQLNRCSSINDSIVNKFRYICLLLILMVLAAFVRVRSFVNLCSLDDSVNA